MKITDFLKKYSLIDSKFIIDFYSFYDEGKNEFDFTINIEILAKWLNTRKEHLKTLLESNFEEDEDYIIFKENNKKGIGNNNTKTVMLTYTCAKLLCMISKCKKADVIRRFYVDLEKLIITYKDSIVRDLNNQMQINADNTAIIERNKEKALVYILKLDDNTNINDFNDNTTFDAKIGKSDDIKQRMKEYNVGRISELPIVFVYLTDDIDGLENCLKDCLNRFKINKNKENFRIDLDMVKNTIKYCNKRNSILIKQNKKLMKGIDDRKFVIIIDKENIDKVDELFNDINKLKKKESNKIKTGSNKIKTGSKKIKTGSKKIKTGSKKIKTGSKKIKTGSKKIKTGSKKIKTGSKKIKLGRP